MSRLEFISDHFGEALKTAIQERESGHDMDGQDHYQLVERFSSYDPSRNKSATQWLVTTYLNEGFLLEDLSKAYETLLVFSQVKRLLPVNQRSLNGYKTLASMWKTIEEAGLLNSSRYWVEKMGKQGFPGVNRENLTSKEEKKQEKDRAYKESILVYQDEALEVVVPLTEFAAKWHGKGTRWCTSADENNYFHEYNKEAPLIIMKEKRENGKSQLWVTKDEIQFMDASDAPIERIGIEDVKFPIVKWACDINGIAIRYYPEELLGREMCLAAVQQNGLALPYIPEKFLDKEICLAAVKQDGIALDFVPYELRDYEMCLTAVQQNGLVLHNIPESFPNYEMYLAAVKNNGEALHDIPKEFRDKEICLAAVKQDGLALRYVSKELRDYNMCMVAVQQDGDVLQYVPEKFRDELSQYISKEDVLDKWKEDIFLPLRDSIMEQMDSPPPKLTF